MTGDRVRDTQMQLEHLIARDRVPGAVAALVFDGTTEIVAAGMADLHEKRPIDGATVMQAASLAKVLTGCAVLQLVRADAIDLDASAQHYLSRYRLPPSPFAKDSVTIRQILSHTAGLNVSDYPGFAPGAILPTLEDSLRGVGGLTDRLEVVAQPGATFMYSGGGFTLLQLLVEEVTGTDFTGFMRETLLQPLGMVRSTFAFPVQARDLARPSDATGAAMPVYRYEAAAAAGLYTCASDLGRFLDAWIGGSDPLGSNMLATMASPHADTGSVDGLWSRYGLACEIGDIGGTRVAGHHGVNRGWRALMAAEIGGRRGLAVLVNSDRATALVDDVAASWFS